MAIKVRVITSLPCKTKRIDFFFPAKYLTLRACGVVRTTKIKSEKSARAEFRYLRRDAKRLLQMVFF